MLNSSQKHKKVPTHSYISIITILWLSLSICPAYAQQYTDSILVWNKNHKLTPADFKHHADSFAAHIGYGYRMSTLLDISIDVSQYEKGDSVYTYNIYPVFYRYQSWLHDTDKLEHEQVHFDITEIYARRMRRYLNLIKTNPRLYKHANEKLRELYAEHEQYQSKYDRETNSGRFPNMQILWHKNIGIQLDTLKKYDKPRGKIMLKNTGVRN